VAEEVVSLAAGSVVHRQHEITPPGTGLQSGLVQIEDQDALAVDNKAWYCFAVPERVNVLLVGELAAIRPLQLALVPSPEKEKLISLQIAGREGWDAGNLSEFEAIIFCDPAVLNISQASRLAHYVETGGGLMIFPGSHTDLAAFNRDLLTRLGTPQWGEVIGKAGSGNAFLSWQTPDLTQPLLSGMLRPGSKLSLPHFFQAVRLVGNRIDAPLSFQNGMAFLSQTTYGQGKVILAASSAEASWSDWSQRGIFAPLIHRLTLSLAGGYKERCQSLTVGDNLEVPAGSGGAVAAVLTLPDDQELRLPPRTVGQKISYLQPHLESRGIYRLKTASGPRLAAVNVPAGESDLTAANLPAAYPAWEAAGLTVVRPETVIQAVKASRYGRELWKTALVAGLLILALESLLGSTLTQKSPSVENEPD
jgi:hypothetical protein